jgi:GNAT superfamily N-acetyltransferase
MRRASAFKGSRMSSAASPPAAPDPASDVRSRMVERWQRIDPLLPTNVPWSAVPDCGAPIVVSGADGRTAATGGCEHWTGPPESLDLSWGAARRFRLSAEVAGPDVTGGLDELLGRWCQHLAEVTGTGDPDTAAVVDWPCRDVDGVAALLRHGLAPLEVLGARAVPREAGRSNRPFGQIDLDLNEGTAGGLRIRRAGPGDIPAVARMGLGIIRWDSLFGKVTERPGTLGALEKEAAGLVGGPGPWTWLAERDGAAVGLLAAQPPAAAGWIAPFARRASVAYLMLMFVEPGERGGGAGGALVETFHRAAEAAGVELILLHYEQLNPLSAPFWNRHGYRPLWTTWQATPASVMR